MSIEGAIPKRLWREINERLTEAESGVREALLAADQHRNLATFRNKELMEAVVAIARAKGCLLGARITYHKTRSEDEKAKLRDEILRMIAHGERAVAVPEDLLVELFPKGDGSRNPQGDPGSANPVGTLNYIGEQLEALTDALASGPSRRGIDYYPFLMFLRRMIQQGLEEHSTKKEDAKP